MKKIFICFLLFASALATAQSKKNYTIQGTLKSKVDSTFLESATIHLEKIKDSSVVSYTISDKTGKFKLEGSTFENELRLVASFVGYKPFSQKITFDKKDVSIRNY